MIDRLQDRKCCGLFNPGKPISIDAMVVHHITDKMVADKPLFQESDEHAELQKLVSDINNVMLPTMPSLTCKCYKWREFIPRE
jgi:hypothetical protein